MLKKIQDYLFIATMTLRRKRLKHIFAKIGNGLYIYGKPTIYYGKNIYVGENVNINRNVTLNATESKIVIGNNVTLSEGCKILAASYDVELFIQKHIRNHVYSEVVIGNNTWICAGATILPGVCLSGENVIVAADAVVTNSFDESNVVLAGNPAKIVKNYG